MVDQDTHSGELFAQSPITTKESIEAVVDSSRYFVIKLVDSNSGQQAVVGLGFSNSSFAFDMMAAVQDYFNRLKKVDDVVEFSFGKDEVESFTIPLPNAAGLSNASAELDQDDFGDFQS